MNELQKKTAQAIVNIFETSRAQGNYGSVTLLEGDPGHLTYGRSQTTLASGNLFLLCSAYCSAPDAEFATQLRGFLDAMGHRDTVLDHNRELRTLLSRAGDDLVMQRVQDEFFDRVYWQPAAAAAERLKIKSALGTTVVYDSHIHGAWGLIRDRTTAKFGSPEAGETAWATHYVEERKEWLATHPKPLLRKTVYRMDAFSELIAGEKWDLPLPLRVRGVEITEAALEGATVRASAEESGERILRLETPLMTGEDVERLQRALKNAGLAVTVDSVFGNETDAAVRSFQNQTGLKADGIVGPATRSRLSL